jgi:ferredoxin
MRVTVNQTTCIAAENCGATAPRVFSNPEASDGFVELLDANPPESEWVVTRLAVALCPSASIHIADDR